MSKRESRYIFCNWAALISLSFSSPVQNSMYGNVLKYQLEDYWNLGLLGRRLRSALATHMNKIYLCGCPSKLLCPLSCNLYTVWECSHLQGVVSGDLLHRVETPFQGKWTCENREILKTKKDLTLWKGAKCTIRKPDVTGSWKLCYPVPGCGNLHECKYEALCFA